MDLYTLDSTFLKQDTIDDFVSVIWTERYTSAGDVTLLLNATPEMTQKLSEGIYLSQSESQEVMLLETLSTDKGILTVTGSSLLSFLNGRVVWGYNWLAAPGHAISYTVYFM